MRQALPIPQRVMAVVLSVLFVFCPFAAHAAGESDTAADPVLLPIIMYHEVKPNKSGKDAIQPWEFEADLKWLADNGYTTIVMADLIAYVRDGTPLPEKPILITFDDGYRSNYDLVYPILREYGVKACISIIVLMPDLPTDNFCTWEQLREMTDSGLVEVGSHSYRLHNLGEDKGNYEKDGTNGVERRPGESDGDFQARVLDDIQKSHDRIAAELGSVTCFAYPFGCTDPDAKALVDALFPVSLMTVPQCADLAKGLHDLPRYAVHMETNLADLLN